MRQQKKSARPRAENEAVLREDVTLNLPVWMLDSIRSIANDCGIPREDLIKVWVAEKVLSREAASRRHHRDVD